MKCPGRDQMEALLAAMACAQRWGLVGSLGGVGQHLHSSKCISSYGGNAGREVVVLGGKGAWAALMASCCWMEIRAMMILMVCRKMWL